MNAIGGYFELELAHGKPYHKNCIEINTARNALEYILLAKKYKKIYLPFYTCDVLLEPIKKLKVSFDFYKIKNSFLPNFDYNLIKKDEVFLYTNYFGVCDKQVKYISNICKNLIVDNAQAFYSKPLNRVDTFYSARKFFGIPDGAYLYTDKFIQDQDIIEQDISINRFQHLLGRIEFGPENYFEMYRLNEISLKNQPIKKMSRLTHEILSSIEYKTIAKKRRENYEHIEKNLGKINRLKIKLSNNSVPMVYPLLTENKGEEIRDKLINSNIYVAKYWPNVTEWIKEENSFELFLTKNLLALPIDQRYSIKDIDKYLQIINLYV